MKNFKNSKASKILCLCLALIFIISAFTGCKGKEEPKKEVDKVITTAGPTTTSPYLSGQINPLTGEDGYDKALLKNRPLLVSVENHPAARPQWGITSADIVWEMLAEGGITRMLLMFSDKSRLPEKVGPTRSARHYFVELAEGFDAIFVHFGGSPKAYRELKNRGTDNIDGRTQGAAFARDSSRNTAIEHRAYTTQEKIAKAIETNKIRTEINKDYASPFKFGREAVIPTGDACNELTVPFSSSFTYRLKYYPDEKLYYSSLNGNAFKDGNNDKQQSFTNIIMCYVDVASMNDKKHRITLDLSEGTGLFVSNGKSQNITWKKGDYEDMMKFYVEGGKELALNKGRTYIALVPTTQQKNVSVS